MIALTLRPAHAAAASYGMLYESVQTVEVTWPGVHNRHHPHRVRVWSENGEDRIVLSAEAVVIADPPVSGDPNAGTVRLGPGAHLGLVFPDRNLRVYSVNPRRGADPELVPLPPTVGITWDQLEAWAAAGRSLRDDEVTALVPATPDSSTSPASAATVNG